MQYIILFLGMFFVIRTLYKFRIPNEENISEKEESEEIIFSYELIDSIARERDRAKGIEDIISWAECYRMGEVSRMFRVSWTDAAGDNQFETFVSDDFIEYLHSERDRIRSSLSRKIRPF